MSHSQWWVDLRLKSDPSGLVLLRGLWQSLMACWMKRRMPGDDGHMVVYSSYIINGHAGTDEDWRYLPYVFGLFFRAQFQGTSPQFIWPNIWFNVPPL